MNSITDNRGDTSLPINERKVVNHKHKIIEIKEKGKLVVPIDFINKVRYLHKEVGPIEWSGRLVWKILKGNIDDPSSIEAEVVDMIPMDIGNATYTEFETGDEAIKYFQKYPKQLGKVKMGIIHTHHNMRAFFSGTDMGALEDCATTDSLLLSLIVNFDEKPVAKIAYMVPETTTEKVKYYPSKMFKKLENFFLKEQQIEVTKDVLVTLDLDVEWKGQSEVKDQYFLDTLAEIKKAKTVSNVKSYKPSYINGNHHQSLNPTIGNQRSKIGKQTSIPYKRVLPNSNFSLESKKENGVKKTKEGIENLNTQKSISFPKPIDNRFAKEEEIAMKKFIFMCIWNEEEIPKNSFLLKLLEKDSDVFIMNCCRTAENDYTGGQVEFTMKDAERIAEGSKALLQEYYEAAFYTLDIEYQSTTLQSAIYKKCARDIKLAPVSSFLGDAVADVLIEESETVLSTPIEEEESIEEKMYKEWGEQYYNYKDIIN